MKSYGPVAAVWPPAKLNDLSVSPAAAATTCKRKLRRPFWYGFLHCFYQSASAEELVLVGAALGEHLLEARKRFGGLPSAVPGAQRQPSDHRCTNSDPPVATPEAFIRSLHHREGARYDGNRNRDRDHYHSRRPDPGPPRAHHNYAETVDVPATPARKHIRGRPTSFSTGLGQF